MSQEPTLTGGCFCGAARYSIQGRPLLSAYCHCTLCQRFTGGAFIHTIHFPASAFTWTHPETLDGAILPYSVPIKPWKTRWRCKQCGVTIASYNSNSDKWSVWGTQLDRGENHKTKNWDIVRPTCHMFYATRHLDIDDNLGKWAGYENSSERLG